MPPDAVKEVFGCTVVQRVSRISAAQRTLEGEHAAHPLFKDPLGAELGGPYGMAVATRGLELFEEECGAGLHTYLAVRTYAVDQAIKAGVQELQARFPSASHIQVMGLGAGMDTRPWRLQGLGDVVWFDVDAASALSAKLRKLTEAGAQIEGAQGLSSTTPVPPQYPLLCKSYSTVAWDVLARGAAQTTLKEALTKPATQAHTAEPGSEPAIEQAIAQPAVSFDPALPTVWVGEGIGMYMARIESVISLWQDAARLSPPGGAKVVLTVTSGEVRAAYQRGIKEKNLPTSLAFCDYTHSLEDFVTGGATTPDSPNLMHELGWHLDALSGDFQHMDLPAEREQSPRIYPYFGSYVVNDYLKKLDTFERLAVFSRM
eukprot:CAMPEP_0119105152 /NCGR_PEP_ID=MMETSP1180-20130426/3195_1 /TAXON_ID=3052 ORGANISM="Chlamydomonas cf sp, Strain CCMP681" /NCGR_SAMPLE_ID=MMETSP1180 /ASSEMBLY_ACC=CAM_ASM_000741 /LENGTH=372 /DNA_ID=CAMNT_0007090137 /DNA_START=121 /DNA_END=1239 /DNA_ORIENTATION=-